MGKAGIIVDIRDNFPLLVFGEGSSKRPEKKPYDVRVGMETEDPVSTSVQDVTHETHGSRNHSVRGSTGTSER